MNRKKFAVVTISYNQGKYIREAIESIFVQKCPVDYCIVDAGSNDGSREIIRKYSKRLKYVFESDRGPADGLNKGFKRVKGDIYYYLNADDILLPGIFNKISNLLEDPNEGKIIMGGLWRIDEFGKKYGLPSIPWNVNLNCIKTGYYVACQQSTFYTREAWKKAGVFNIKNTTCWDTELLVDSLLSGCTLKTTDEICGLFRVYSESLTGGKISREKFIQDHLGISKKIFSGKGILIDEYIVKKALFLNPMRRLRQLNQYLRMRNDK